MNKVVFLRKGSWEAHVAHAVEELHKDDVMGITLLVHKKDSVVRMDVAREGCEISLETVLGRIQMLQADLIRTYGE